MISVEKCQVIVTTWHFIINLNRTFTHKLNPNNKLVPVAKSNNFN